MEEWNFPSNNDAGITGISDAGIETFRGAPYKSLAREICQNSLDACLVEDKPVKVEFDLFSYESELLPGYKDLKQVLKSCKDFSKVNEYKKGIKFFDNALKVINNKKVNILRISDYNTTGLMGSDKNNNSEWINLIKGSGMSNKEGGAGGSFGIGKSAPFACSALRTVFYSTLDKKGKVAYQGVSRLASCNLNGYITQGIGYYGKKEGNAPIHEQMSIEDKYTRKESGTDIYILGFNVEKNWKIEILSSILDGFLVSIWNGLLEVKTGEIILNKSTLDTIIDTYKEQLSGNIKDYYKVLTSEKNIIKKWDFHNLGEVKLYLLKSEGLCRKVAMSRSTGMKIFEQNRLSTYIEFAGVLILCGQDLNSFFRDMETPRHDKWEPKRTDNKNAEKYKKELYRTIKDYVNELQEVDNNEELDVEGLGEYLADEIEFGDKEKIEGISNKINELTIDEEILENRNKFGVNKGRGKDDYADIFGNADEEGEFLSERNYEGIGKKNTNGRKDDERVSENSKGDKEAKEYIEINPINKRIFCSNKIKKEYRLIFNSPKNIKNGYLKLSILGEQGEIDCIIEDAFIDNEQLKIQKNKIFIQNIYANKKYLLTIYIDYDDYCTLGVNLYGFKK